MKKFLSILLAIVLIISLAACGGPDLSSPEATVKGFCDAIKSLNIEDVQKYLSRNIINERTLGLSYLPQSFVSLLKDLNSATNYNVGTAEISGDNATVSLGVEYIDSTDIIGPALEQYTNKARELASQGKKMTTEDMENLLIESIRDCAKKNNPKKTAATAEFQLEKADGSWKITGISDNLASIILCNLVEALEGSGD